MTDINFSDLMNQASSGFDPIPDSTYDVSVFKAEATMTQNGKHMIKLQLVVEGGPHNGRKLWDNLVLSPESPGALGFFFEHMKALGLGSDFFSSNPSMDHVAQSLTGRRATATVGSKTYQGQERNEVTKYAPGTGPSAGPAAAAPGPVPGPAQPGGGLAGPPSNEPF